MTKCLSLTLCSKVPRSACHVPWQVLGMGEGGPDVAEVSSSPWEGGPTCDQAIRGLV